MVIDLRRKKTPTTFLVIKSQTVDMVETFRFLGTTMNRNEMGGQYDINRQESPTTHVLPPPTEEDWSQHEDPHTVLSGSY